MTNFGSRQLRLVEPFIPAFREARSAVGAADLLAQAEECKTVAEAVRDCVLVVGTTAVRDRVPQQPVQSLGESSARTIQEHLSTAKVALLFGSEKIGLTNSDFSHCQWLLRIPTKPRNISMNLGQSVAVCLYELAREVAATPAASEVEMPTAGDMEHITECLLECLQISGYVKPGSDAMFEKKARTLIRRFRLEAYDAKLLLGMLRQIVWKLRQSKG